MPPVTASAPATDSAAGLLAGYLAHLARTGRGNVGYERAARAFLARWPDPQAWASQPLTARLNLGDQTRPFVVFLMVSLQLRPGYDYLVARKLGGVWREVPASPLAADMERFLAAAGELGYSAAVARGVASQVVVRLLIQTGRPLHRLTAADLDALTDAVADRETRRDHRTRHYRHALHAARAVLFHLGVLPDPPPVPAGRRPHEFADRLHGVSPLLSPTFLAYLQRRRATCGPGTVSNTVSRLTHFGRHLAAVEPELPSIAALDRRRHIESYLAVLTTATRPRDGAAIAVSERRARVIAVSRFLADITEWGWLEAPPRQLVFPSDVPRPPRPLPRYLPPDADRRLTAALENSLHRQAADALLLARATGLRIGELLDLELDCIHEIPGLGAWLKVPLGKLDTERMVPIDEETLPLVDRLAQARSPGRPLPHPRTGRPTEFLLTRHGLRLSATGLRNELRRASAAAGLGDVVPHQLRHTYATALVNAGCSLQALMALLGHQTASMSLRYARLFDTTVRADYERALTLAKSRLGPVLPEQRTTLPLVDVTGGAHWRETPLIKARLAGGYCLRTPAQGVCPYTNICENCPNFRTDTGFLAVLGTQRADAAALAADAEARGWTDEATRHRNLVERLDELMNRAAAG
jgi:integrase